MNAEDYVTPEAKYAEQVEDMSGVRGRQAGAAPYPLYGLPSMGQPEPAVAFWKRPTFNLAAGTVLGFGLGYVFFGWLKPRLKPNPAKKRARKRSEGE